MFTVYKITNLINQKSYVGSSIRVEKRWREHCNTAFNKNSPRYNYPLYKAFRKYGLENFKFEILKDDFSNYEEMVQYEHDMIIYFKSYSNGYNQTLSTNQVQLAQENCQRYIQSISQRCAKVDINNNIIEVYNSYHDAARQNLPNNTLNENIATHIRRVCKGEISSYHNEYFRDLDEHNQIIPFPFKRPNGKKKLICIPLDNPEEITYYDSISDASKALTNGDRRQIELHLQGSYRYSVIRGNLLREVDIYGNIIENNILIDQKIDLYNQSHPLINGERKTISEWCKFYNITQQCYYYRLKQGYSIEEALTMKKRGG